MKPFDPLSTVIPLKNSFEFFNPPKKVHKVLISVLNRDEVASMAPHFDPYRRQWLQNLILIGVNGSTFSSKSASMAPEFYPNRRQWLHIGQWEKNLEPLTPIWIKFWSHWRQYGSNSGAVDADLDRNVEPLTPIWIKFWSHWRRYGSKCGAIDAISSRFSTEI